MKQPFDRAPLEWTALSEYNHVLGRLLQVDYICGYDDHDNSGDWACDPPIIVRVEKTDSDSLLHWNDEWLDPYWDVALVSGVLPKGVRSIWIDGPSHNAITGERDWKGVTLLPEVVA